MNPGRDEQFIQFGVDDLPRVIAQDEMNLVRGGVELPEQPLEVDGTARAGRGEDKLHYR